MPNNPSRSSVTQETNESRGSILSIQSHTVFGYVGNRASVFPLQLLGFDVSFINSVQFSNHTGYKNGFKGQILTGEQLKDLKLGLSHNNLLNKFDNLMTGYIGSVSFLQEIIALVKELRTISQDNGKSFTFFCDPVLGDHGKLYVPEQLIEVYIKQVLPLVDILTPNQFELETLTQKKIKSEADILEAFKFMHLKGIRTIFLTSSDLVFEEGFSYLFASVVNENEETKFIKARFPSIEGRYTGTGDLIAALLLGWSKIHPHDLPLVVEKSLATMQSVLQRTRNSFEKGHNDELELRLVESRFDILTPDLENHSIKVETIV